MNIGETDADGWTYVRFGDAAKAAQDKKHEVESRPDAVRDWAFCISSFHANWQYRIREKARTITVTDLPRPTMCFAGIAGRAVVDFKSNVHRDAFMTAIQSAMETQP